LKEVACGKHYCWWLMIAKYESWCLTCYETGSSDTIQSKGRGSIMPIMTYESHIRILMGSLKRSRRVLVKVAKNK